MARLSQIGTPKLQGKLHPTSALDIGERRSCRFGGAMRELQSNMAVTLGSRRRAGPILGRKGRSKPMEKFVIEGGVPLSGTLTPAGNKNAALPILAACVLTGDEVLVHNVPRIRDVEAMVAILEHLGVRVAWVGPNELSLCAADVHGVEVDPELAEQIRASFLLAAPLLARFQRAVMPPPGGDILLTAEGGLRSTDVFMDEPSVMATENALMAAALTPGQTVIGNAACEPHVQDLARMLVKMGADIQGIGSNLLTVNGCEQLHGCEHRIAPDHIEIGSFIALAGVTGGELRVRDTVPGDLRMIRLVFERLGLRTELHGDDVLVPGGQRLVAQADVGEYKSKIQDGPWPAFPADLTSIAIALATQAEGSILIHEWMFENRLIFTDKLILMGADIVMCDPHRAIVTGPRRLRGERVESPDIRAGMAMLLAALCADGRSEIGNIRQIDRGYERIDERLRELGANIERVAVEPSPALHA
jgi:UDP-N-acetylglucosamine 1-carboxyvinyltransferase